MEVSDTDIVQDIKRGNIDAFGELIHRYETKITRYLSKFLYDALDAEDITQEVFLKVYSNIQSFDERQPFSPWIYRIAHNEAINFLRKKKLDTVSLFDVDVLFPHPHAKEESDKETERELMKTKMDEVLGEVPLKYREVLVLYFYEELSYKEIARTLKIPVTTVGVRLTRGKEKVEAVLEAKKINM